MAGRRLRGTIPPVTGLGAGIGNSSASFHVVCLHLKPSSMELTISSSESSSLSRLPGWHLLSDRDRQGFS